MLLHGEAEAAYSLWRGWFQKRSSRPGVLLQHSSIRSVLLPWEGEHRRGQKEWEFSFEHVESKPRSLKKYTWNEKNTPLNTKTLFANSILIKFRNQFATILPENSWTYIPRLDRSPLVFCAQFLLGCTQGIVVSWCAVWLPFAPPGPPLPFYTGSLPQEADSHGPHQWIPLTYGFPLGLANEEPRKQMGR